MRAGKQALAAFAVFVLLLCCRTDAPGPVLPASPVAGQAEIPAAKYVALTFDDGPRAGTTDRLLDGLRERGASATFFLIGEQIAGNEDLLRRMRDEGHQVGNHTWDHVMLCGVSAEEVRREIGRTDAAIRSVLGDGSYWVRPPYGLLNEDQKSGFPTPLIHWSVDPEDWKLRSAQKVTALVLRQTKPGDIILLHDFYDPSVDAALAIAGLSLRHGGGAAGALWRGAAGGAVLHRCPDRPPLNECFPKTAESRPRAAFARGRLRSVRRAAGLISRCRCAPSP